MGRKNGRQQIQPALLSMPREMEHLFMGVWGEEKGFFSPSVVGRKYTLFMCS